VKKEELPTEMQSMDEDGRDKYLAGKRAEREKIQTEINSLARERSAYIRKNAPAKPDSFDARVEGTIKTQAKSIGVAY
jgi:hypothetical protein